MTNNKRNIRGLPRKRAGAGYERSRWNATKHGILSRDTVLPWENRGVFENLVNDLVDEYHPKGPTESQLVDDLADIIWRKKRLAWAEVALSTFEARKKIKKEFGFDMEASWASWELLFTGKPKNNWGYILSRIWPLESEDAEISREFAEVFRKIFDISVELIKGNNLTIEQKFELPGWLMELWGLCKADPSAGADISRRFCLPWGQSQNFTRNRF